MIFYTCFNNTQTHWMKTKENLNLKPLVILSTKKNRNLQAFVTRNFDEIIAKTFQR